MQRGRALAAHGQLPDELLVCLLVPGLQCQLLAAPADGLGKVAGLHAVPDQTGQRLAGQVIHPLGHHPLPLLEGGAVAQAEARQKGTPAQGQGRTAGGRRG